jgi:acyl-CoA thioesterase II
VAANPEHVEQFHERLTLTRIDRDIFQGYCHAGAPLRAFGGQVAAQALVAAGMTVDQDTRRVHSLHGYFLRAGRTGDPIVYLVERPRDGRSFSTRLVRAVQYGETIFTMSASFAITEDGPQRSDPMPAVPTPEQLPSVDLPVTAVDPRLRELGYPDERLIDVRLVEPDLVSEITGGHSQRMAWFRTLHPMPDDDLLQVCAMTYFSDVTLPGTTLVPLPKEERQRLALLSIDHAMWFHRTFRADEWLLFVQDSHIATGGHALSRGEFFRGDGELIATAVQEVLMRPRTEPPVVTEE